MSKKCALVQCENIVPRVRKRTAKYCSPECYYEAKKLRSSNRYSLLKIPANKITAQERILSFCHSIAELSKQIHLEDMIKLKFDFGMSTTDTKGPNGQICKCIGRYCYFINKDKTVSIWKLK